MIVCLAPPEAFSGAVVEMLTPAMPGAGVDQGWVRERLDSCHAQLWLAIDGGETAAALLTQMTMDDELECLLAGGVRAKDWAVPAVKAITAWGFEHGAVLCRVWGRPGWRRLLKGWEFKGMENGLALLEMRRG